jgi:F-type H+-transporting ATPase subunit epsilon
MKLTILKIDKPLYIGDFEKISLPATEGGIEILPNHAPFMSALKKGKIFYTADGEENTLEIEKGFVEVNKLEVLVIL